MDAISGEWDSLEKGEFARGSVIPEEPAIGEVVLAGYGFYENPVWNLIGIWIWVF